MKVVLDTNTIVSAIGWDGPPRRVLLALREGKYDLVTTTDLLEELTNGLSYPKLRPIAAHPLLPEILEWLHRPGHMVIPQERINVIRADRTDNLVLEAAVAGKASVVISGDRDLLALKQFREIRILTAREFAAAHQL